MRVVFDFESILGKKYSGIYTYGAGLLRGFNKVAEKPEAIGLYSAGYEQDAKRLVENQSGWVTLKKVPLKLHWLENYWRYFNHPALQTLIGDFDIYHCLFNFMPPVRNRPRIMTVHDMRRYKLPGLYINSKLWRFEQAFAHADHFIAVSQSTKLDLIQFFTIPEDKITVIYLAADERLKPLSEDNKNLLKEKFSKQVQAPLDRFIIAISASDKRKNLTRIVSAFRYIKKELPRGTKLVVTGELPKDFENPKRKEEYLHEDVIWTNFVDDVTQWIACSDGLIYTSLYEGFGIPILEAFACGVPVISSNCSSMPEVAGDAAILVDPYNKAEIGRAIAEIYNNEKKRQKMIEAGLQRNRNFSWEKTALQTFNLYKRLI